MREIKFRIFYAGIMYSNEEIDYLDLNNLTAEFGVTYSRFSDEDFHLMQFTGLKDRNGVDIYEGDILAIEEYKFEGYDNNYDFVISEPYKKNIEVVFERGRFQMKNEYYNLSIGEVIGNIYENPELLND